MTGLSLRSSLTRYPSLLSSGLPKVYTRYAPKHVKDAPNIAKVIFIVFHDCSLCFCLSFSLPVSSAFSDALLLIMLPNGDLAASLSKNDFFYSVSRYTNIISLLTDRITCILGVIDA